MNNVSMVFRAAALLLLAHAAMANAAVTGKRSPLGFSLSGGLGTIHGGDLNRMIADWHAVIAGPDYEALSPTIEWADFQGVSTLGAEVFYHLSTRFAVSLGFEVLKKHIQGEITFTGGPGTDEWNDNYYFYHVEYRDESAFKPENSLSAIPVILNAYCFVTGGRPLRAFVKAGVGYYFASLKSTYQETTTYHYRTDRYDWPGGALSDVYRDESTTATTFVDRAKCGALGFHAGAGFEFDVTSSMTLLIEGMHRTADLGRWKGTGSVAHRSYRSYGWQSEGYQQDEEAWTYSYPGDLCYLLIDKGPRVMINNDEWGLGDVRPALIKLGGFSFRVGFKIRF